MPIITINAKTLQDWLDKNEVVLIDVREDWEHKEASIPGAQLIPLAQLQHDNLPAFDGKKLVFHCRSGGRSLAACKKIQEKLPEITVYNLEGGITAWQSCAG
ncbi:MAG: rhodanese-like domain-containing protein [Legionellaceae bacterium]|nr:rhodanese-like domain-containing protein [Legionellaceae bacterium]